MRIVIPGVPPSSNHMYRRHTNKQGRTMNVITSKAQSWLDECELRAKIWANRTGWRCRPKGKKVVVRLWFYWPDHRRRDTHNTLKALMDSLEGSIYEDDKWGLPRIMDFDVDRERPRVEIEVVDALEVSA